MSTQWFCKLMGEEFGPMSAQQLLMSARSGQLTRDDFVRKGSDDRWIRAELVKGLFDTTAPPVAATVSASLNNGLKSPLPTKHSAETAGQQSSELSQLRTIGANLNKSAIVAPAWLVVLANLMVAGSSLGILFYQPTLSQQMREARENGNTHPSLNLNYGIVFYAQVPDPQKSGVILKLPYQPAKRVQEFGLVMMTAYMLLMPAAVWFFARMYGIWKFVINSSHVLGLTPSIKSPQQALGFLFIPFFNLYWVFKFMGIAGDANQICAVRRIHTPRAVEYYGPGTVVAGFVSNLLFAIGFPIVTISGTSLPLMVLLGLAAFVHAALLVLFAHTMHVAFTVITDSLGHVGLKPTNDLAARIGSTEKSRDYANMGKRIGAILGAIGTGALFVVVLIQEDMATAAVISLLFGALGTLTLIVVSWTIGLIVRMLRPNA